MDNHIIDRLNAANVPSFVHERTLDTIPQGAELKTYLTSDAYTLDRKAGIGINLFGAADVRARVFPVLGRAMCLCGDDVFYTQAVVICDIACSDEHPLTEKALNCTALFVSNFCTPNEPMPFTSYQRATIEQFLIARCYGKRRNYLSSSATLLSHTWWSEDFKADQLQFIRDVGV